MIRTDYDLWRCAKCGSERRQPSVPHNPPSCCGTGMWFISFLVGRSYESGVGMDGGQGIDEIARAEMERDQQLEYHRLRRGD